MYVNPFSQSIEQKVFPMKIRDGSGMIAFLYGVIIIPLFLLTNDFLKLNLIELEKFSDNPIMWLFYLCGVIIIGGSLMLITLSLFGGLILFFVGYGAGILVEFLIYPLYFILKVILQIKTKKYSPSNLQQQKYADLNILEIIILFVGLIIGFVVYFFTPIRITHLAVKIFSQTEYSSAHENTIYFPLDLLIIPLSFSILICIIVFWIPFLFNNRKSTLIEVP